MSRTKLIIWIVVVVLLFSVSYYIQSDAHEQAHAVICDKFNGDVVEFEVGLTNSHILCDVERTPEYLLAQSNVESFGYQIQALGDMLLIMFSIWLFISIKVIK